MHTTRISTLTLLESGGLLRDNPLLVLGENLRTDADIDADTDRDTDTDMAESQRFAAELKFGTGGRILDILIPIAAVSIHLATLPAWIKFLKLLKGDVGDVVRDTSALPSPLVALKVALRIQVRRLSECCTH